VIFGASFSACAMSGCALAIFELEELKSRLSTSQLARDLADSLQSISNLVQIFFDG